ncbi:MAG: hypothetical protein AMS19_14855, partial [Gemmatimonas sp. SG8_23]
MTDKDPKRELDEFLAAPDSVRQNERELSKLRDRKARDRAREERERATKAPGRPTLEDILADVVRVAEDEATNPYHEFRSISRRRYELYGHFPIEYVLEHGRFQHVKAMAGLADTEGNRKLLLAREHRSKREHDERYFRRYLLPHVEKFPELRRATAEARMAVAISDTHSAFMDPFYWMSFLAFVEDAQPDVILLVADHVDGSEISNHPKVPGHTMALQLELDIFRAMVQEIRETVPAKTRIVLVGDNHFFDRLVRYLTQVAPALANLRSMRVDRLLGLDDLDIDLAMGGSWLSPDGQEDNRPFLRLWDRLNVTHGTKLGKYPAAAERGRRPAPRGLDVPGLGRDRPVREILRAGRGPGLVARVGHHRDDAGPAPDDVGRRDRRHGHGPRVVLPGQARLAEAGPRGRRGDAPILAQPLGANEVTFGELIGALFGWLGGFVEWIFDWVPVYEIVQVNERGVKYPRGKDAVQLDPGIHWYVPNLTEIQKHHISRMVLNVESLPL